MSVEKKLEVLTEILVMGMISILAAFFCFRVLLLPKANNSPVHKIYEVEETLSQK
tara:strand:+ start:465 stop:629 length:165 start_codon:yes stop_codon:yes gene_type:complete